MECYNKLLSRVNCFFFGKSTIFLASCYKIYNFEVVLACMHVRENSLEMTLKVIAHMQILLFLLFIVELI
jgi:hypothetical protein